MQKYVLHVNAVQTNDLATVCQSMYINETKKQRTEHTSTVNPITHGHHVLTLFFSLCNKSELHSTGLASEDYWIMEAMAK